MSTSKLQRKVSELLSVHLGRFTIRENYRPEWLQTGDGNRLELDFYIDELKAAIEVQGKQHYEFVPFFHRDSEGFSDSLARDRLKKTMCQRMGIDLYEVCSENDTMEIIELLDTNYQYPVHQNALDEQKRLEKSEKDAARKASAIHSIYGIRDIIVAIENGKPVTLKVKNRLEKHAKRARFILDCKDFSKEQREAACGILDMASEYCNVYPTVALSKAKRKRKKKNAIPQGYGRRMPGATRTRNRGNKLEIVKDSEKQYKVSGGETEHIVIYQIKEDFRTYQCDCDGQANAKDKVCSHTWAVFSNLNQVYTDRESGQPHPVQEFTIAQTD